MSKASARAGVVDAGDGRLTIMRNMRGYAQKNSVELVGTSSVPRPSSDSRLASDSRPTRDPPGFPSHPPPGLTPVDPSQAASMAMFSQVQAMLKKFEDTFERRIAQVEAQMPRGRSRSPLDSSFSKLRRSNDFSSPEEYGDGRLALSGSRAVPQGSASGPKDHSW